VLFSHLNGILASKTWKILIERFQPNDGRVRKVACHESVDVATRVTFIVGALRVRLLCQPFCPLSNLAHLNLYHRALVPPHSKSFGTSGPSSRGSPFCFAILILETVVRESCNVSIAAIPVNKLSMRECYGCWRATIHERLNIVRCQYFSNAAVHHVRTQFFLPPNHAHPALRMTDKYHFSRQVGS
jgi:hypothetical protein